MAAQQVPVTIITGFLGSGKTTLIKRLLSAPHGLRIGLILNEIGQAGIDQVPEADRAYVELTEGCACCIRNPDLIAALEEIAKQPDLDRILIETSGLADPLPLTWTMTRPELVELLRMDAVVATVDTTQLEQASTEEWKNQVRCADLVVLTKEELAGPGAGERAAPLVHDVNPPARFLSSGQTTLPELLLDFTLPSPRTQTLDPSSVRHSDFRGIFIADQQTYDIGRFEDWLELLPEEVFRAKGILRGDAGEWAVFHVVGGRVQMDFDVAPPTHGQSRFAFFGRRLDEAHLRSLLAPLVRTSS